MELKEKNNPSKPREKKKSSKEHAKVGQGFNDARGEIPDTQDIPKHNGLNVNNDPAHLRAKSR
jgi:uncharacterized membrane protein YtjA (UPF0391 family)